MRFVSTHWTRAVTYWLRVPQDLILNSYFFVNERYNALLVTRAMMTYFSTLAHNRYEHRPYWRPLEQFDGQRDDRWYMEMYMCLHKLLSPDSRETLRRRPWRGLQRITGMPQASCTAIICIVYKWATFGMPCNLSKEHKVLQEILNHNAIYMRDVQRSWNCPGKPGLFRLDCDRKITRRPVIYTTVEGFWLIKFVKGLELETRWWQSMGLQWRASGSQLLPSSSSAVRIPLRWVSHNLMDLLENSELLCWKFHFTTNKNFTFLFIFSGPVKGYFLSS